MGREEETNEERQSSALIFLVLWRLLLSDQESNKNGIQYTKPLYFPSLFVSSRKKSKAARMFICKFECFKKQKLRAEVTHVRWRMHFFFKFTRICTDISRQPGSYTASIGYTHFSIAQRGSSFFFQPANHANARKRTYSDYLWKNSILPLPT